MSAVCGTRPEQDGEQEVLGCSGWADVGRSAAPLAVAPCHRGQVATAASPAGAAANWDLVASPAEETTRAAPAASLEVG